MAARPDCTLVAEVGSPEREVEDNHIEPAAVDTAAGMAVDTVVDIEGARTVVADMEQHADRAKPVVVHSGHPSSPEVQGSTDVCQEWDHKRAQNRLRCLVASRPVVGKRSSVS